MAKDSLSKMRADFNAHAKTDQEALNEILKGLAAIQNKLNPEHESYILRPLEKKLEPIAETYDTASHLGKWGMTLLVTASLFIGIIWGILQITASKVSISLP